MAYIRQIVGNGAFKRKFQRKGTFIQAGGLNPEIQSIEQSLHLTYTDDAFQSVNISVRNIFMAESI